MSDAPQAPGWWQASDGRWYPPQDGTPAGGPQPGPTAPPPSYPPAGGYPSSGGYPSGGYPSNPPGGGYATGYAPSGGYAPQGYPSMPPPAPSSGGMNGCLIALLVVLAIGVVVGLGSCVALVVVADDVAEDVEDDLVEEQADEVDDVSQPTCERGTAGDLRATMTVTNDSSERSNYTIEVAFNATNGSLLDTGYATVSALAPGQSTEAVASTIVQVPEQEFTCEVASVQRFSDEL